MSLTTYLNPDVIKDGDISASKIGGISKSITWGELKTLRDAGGLIPGMQYRITDYQCTTIQEGTKSAGHQFDIIVTADDESTLNEVARAIKHTGDSYFVDCDLNVWKIWYCLDNDTTRFAWADSTNGKGVIYRMIDEFHNDVPYDFKNIQFYRQWDSSKSLWSTISKDSTGVPCYTFSSKGDSSTVEFTDTSLNISNNVHTNVIKEYIYSKKQTLNNNCLFNTGSYNNSFGNNCSKNTIGNNSYDNSFGNDCSYNIIGGNDFSNSFGSGCTYNVIGRNYVCYNSFGNGCTHNTIGDSCSNNSFGNDCSFIKFTSDSSAETIYNYYNSNHFGDGCQYIVFKGAETASYANSVKNYNFAQGLQGTSSAYLTIDGKRNRTYETYISKDTDGTIKESIIAEKLDKMIEISYSELVALRDSSKLVSGQQYRITDYTCTTIQEGTRAADHRFDIIVTADSESILNEEARAVKHEGDTYFANNDLSAWKIWYCLDNDATRFGWADSTNGKGVIYRMIDEWNNDIPYDFKNIQFKHPNDTTTYPHYYYTFASDNVENNTDFSLDIANSCYSNTIMEYIKENIRSLNQIVFIGAMCYSNSFAENCFNNSFAGMCVCNSFGMGCSSNRIGQYCTDNSFAGLCLSNSLGIDCHNNIFGFVCGENTLGNSCTYNTFRADCLNNSFAENCYGNTFEEYCSYNTFDTGCYGNSFGSSSSNNTFGESCSYNSLGNKCNYIKFASDKSASTKYNNYRNNHFGDGCEYIVFTGTETSSTYVQNYNFAQGLQGTFGAYLTIDGVRNRVFETKVAQNSIGELKIYCEADLIK